MQSKGESWIVVASTHREPNAFRLTKVRQLFAAALPLGWCPKCWLFGAFGHKTLPAPAAMHCSRRCALVKMWSKSGKLDCQRRASRAERHR